MMRIGTIRMLCAIYNEMLSMKSALTLLPVALLLIPPTIILVAMQATTAARKLRSIRTEKTWVFLRSRRRRSVARITRADNRTLRIAELSAEMVLIERDSIDRVAINF